ATSHHLEAVVIPHLISREYDAPVVVFSPVSEMRPLQDEKDVPAVQRESELDTGIEDADHEAAISSAPVAATHDRVVRGVKQVFGFVDANDPVMPFQVTGHSLNSLLIEELLRMHGGHSLVANRNLRFLFAWEVHLDQVVG